MTVGEAAAHVRLVHIGYLLFVAGLVAASILFPEAISDENVADTRFKHPRGFYTRPFLQVIRSRTPGAIIRYTTDGSMPSGSHGLGGTNPVAVPVYSTMTLRAIGYKHGLPSTNVDTHTYLFLDDVLRQPRYPDGFPRSSLIPGMGYLMELDEEIDPDIVDDPRYRDRILPALRALPSVSIVMDKEDMFGQPIGTDREKLDPRTSGVYFSHRAARSPRPASVEWLHPDAPEKDFRIDAGLASHGIHGVKRSLKLVFHKAYGPRQLTRTIFEDAPHGDTAVSRFDRIVLRSGHTRSWPGENPDPTSLVGDQWVRDTQIAMSGIGARGTFVHLYLNGWYWGLYNVVERPDAWFTSSYMGGAKEDWYAVNHNGELHGDGSRWNYLRGTLKNKDLTTAENYGELERYLDVTQFADYLILGWYARLDDWGPNGNWYGGNRNHPPGPFQFYMWDAEYSLFGGTEPMVRIHEHYRADAATDSPDRIGLFHALSRNRDFMILLADHIYHHCFHGGALTEVNAIARWRRLTDSISSAVITESARWGDGRRVFGEPTRTRDDNFTLEVERAVRLMRGNVDRFIDVLRLEGYYPTLDPPDMILTESHVRLENPNGSGAICFTIDGTDPRRRGGAVSPSARCAKTRVDVPIERGRGITARILTDAEWSALRGSLLPD